MKKLLLTTAIIATAGSAFAHDNFKTQLDNIENAWECQDHFERGDVIAGNIDQFEFCVWHINNNREGFTRDTHWYSILPSGDVVAVEQRLLTSDRKAKSVIETAVHKIIVANLKKEHAANVAAIRAENGKIVGGLSDDIDALKTELADIATTLGDRDPADVIAELKELGDAVAALTDSRDKLQVMFDEANDGITQETVDGIKAELNKALEVQKGLVADKAQELATAKAELAAAKGVIDGLAEIRDLMDVAPEGLQTAINSIIETRDDLQGTVDSLNEQLKGFDIEFSDTALQDIYNAGVAAGVASVDITSNDEGVYMVGFADGVNSVVIPVVDITSDNAAAIEAAKATALGNAPAYFTTSNATKARILDAANTAGNWRPAWTTATESTGRVSITLFNGRNYKSHTVGSPTHFNHGYDDAGYAMNYLSDDGQAINAHMATVSDNRWQTQTVSYTLQIGQSGYGNTLVINHNNLDATADNIEAFAEEIANEFVDQAFETGYLVGYACLLYTSPSPRDS